MKGNRKVKDSVFCSILSDKKYALQAYLDLHPDSDVKEEDIEIVTLENILAIDFYNDFGMSIRGQKVILMEAQSTWSYNIILRVLIYFAHEMEKVIENHKYCLYSSRRLSIQNPEFYVVYSGREEVPDFISLKDVFQLGEEAYIDLKVKVIKNRDIDHFFGQYLFFCRKLEANRALYGDSLEAIQRTIEECIEKNVFKEYFISHHSEVIEMIDLLYDEEKIVKQLIEEEVQKAREEAILQGKAEGKAEGITEGIVEGKAESKKEMAIRLKQKGMDTDFIMSVTDLKKEEIEAL